MGVHHHMRYIAQWAVKAAYGLRIDGTIGLRIDGTIGLRIWSKLDPVRVYEGPIRKTIEPL